MVALSALLILGGLLWYLAGKSLTPYINQYISQVNQHYPGTSFEVIDANIEHAQSLAFVQSISIKDIKNQISPTALALNNITISFDPKTFKKDEIIVNYIVINEANLLINNSGYLSQIESLTSNIADMLQKQTQVASEGLLKDKEPVIKINKITLANLHITMHEDQEPVHEKIYTNLEISVEEVPKAISFSTLSMLKNTLDMAHSLMAEVNQ